MHSKVIASPEKYGHTMREIKRYYRCHIMIITMLKG